MSLRRAEILRAARHRAQVRHVRQPPGSGEAPACAQACPNGAIQITIVDQAAIVAEARKGAFLPGAPAPGYTQPTTRYLSARETARPSSPPRTNMTSKRRRSPLLLPPLVAMLVLTQLSVGAFCVETLLRHSSRRT